MGVAFAHAAADARSLRLFATGVVFFPLLGALIAGLFGRMIGDRGAQLVTCGGLILAALCSWVVLCFVDEPYKVEVLTWLHSGTFEADWVLRVDVLSAVMMFVVSTVSALIHVYSIGYMAHDHSIPRFMSYLSLFTFFMLALVTADNFLQLYFGWEGVGLVSYLLIGFWYTKPSACAAAIKAFLVNRVGDFGFALGIAAIYLVFDSIEFDVVFGRAAEFVDTEIVFLGASVDTLTLICILLFIGAMGKSAQLGLHTWLPDAMEGPTPVSALIHAATMVTAGVFLVARCSPLVRALDHGARLRHLHRRQHRDLRRNRRPRAERHQARDRLLDLLAARLHVLRLRRLGLRRRHLPPLHPRLLQGAPVPRRGLGDPRDVRRAGHAQDGRHLAHGADHLRRDVDRLAGARRHPDLRRLLLEGHDPGIRLGLARPVRGLRLLARHHSPRRSPPSTPGACCS